MSNKTLPAGYSVAWKGEGRDARVFISHEGGGRTIGAEMTTDLLRLTPGDLAQALSRFGFPDGYATLRPVAEEVLRTAEEGPR